MAHELSHSFARLGTDNESRYEQDTGCNNGHESSLTAALNRRDANLGGVAEPGDVQVPQVVFEDRPLDLRPAHVGKGSQDDETPTRAIDVPGLHADDGSFPGYTEDQYFDESSLSKYMSQRSSISFDPQVTTEDGAQHELDVPLPKLSVINLMRGRNLLEEMQIREMQRQLSRARSETDREDYDLETGERIEDGGERNRRDVRYIADQPRWPFLQSTVNELAQQRPLVRVPARDHSASLTSRTTISPGAEEIRTPDSLVKAEDMIPPLPMSSPSQQDWYGPASAELPRRLSSAARSRSFGLERRKSRRTSSRRSTSNSVSPASAFLSQYFPVSPPAAFDGEGQEVGDYVLGREIGFGGFSIIREASTIVDGERISRAVKIVRRNVEGKEETENEKLQAEYDHEIALWRCLSHKHILPLFAVWETDFATFAFTHLNTGGTLFDAVRYNRSGLEPSLARKYAYQVASALRYLHEDMRIVHRDVKLENCLIDVSDPALAETGGKILLCDFGLADYMNSDEHAPSRAAVPSVQQGSAVDASSLAQVMGPSDTSTNIAGSLPYASPEMMHNQEPLSTSTSDIWAFGVVCYAMAVGKLPFQHAFAPRVRMMILGGDYDRAILAEREHGERPSADNGSNGHSNVHSNGNGNSADNENDNEIDKRSYLAGVGQLVQSCLERNLKKRWNIRACLDSQWLLPERNDADEHGGWAS